MILVVFTITCVVVQMSVTMFYVIVLCKYSKSIVCSLFLGKYSRKQASVVSDSFLPESGYQSRTPYYTFTTFYAAQKKIRLVKNISFSYWVLRKSFVCIW